MAYHFHRKEAVKDGLKRIGIECIDTAIKDLQGTQVKVAVYEARKHIKKLRAILSLLEATEETKELKSVRHHLRKPAQALATLRDADAMVDCAIRLAEKFKHELKPALSQAVIAALRTDGSERRKIFLRDRAEKRIIRQLRQMRIEVRQLDMPGRGWKLLGSGLEKAYRTCRYNLRAMEESDGAAKMHAWRKSVKTLGYQLRIFQKAWPEHLDASGRELKTLSTHLGDFQDLRVLKGHLDKVRSVKANVRELLKGIIREEQTDLKTQAVALGKRFFAEKPTTFEARFHNWWRRWRNEPKLKPQSRPSAG